MIKAVFRPFARATLPALLATVGMLLGACSEPPPAGEARNVVIIAIDTVRYDALFLNEKDGVSDDFTGWLDRAVVFNHALAPAPWTVPSVASVLTGLYPAQHGGGRFEAEVADLSKHIPSALASGTPTLPELLSEHDFSNFAVTAHPWFKSGYGLERGFSKIILHRGADWLVDRGMRWVRRRDDDERFFLYVHLMEAHDWHLRPERFDDYIAEIAPENLARYHAAAPAEICEDAERLICRRWVVYLHAIQFQRGEIARLLSEMQDIGALDNTVVLIYADHGEEFHDHRDEQRERGVDPREIYGFGHGQSLYQELIHVPLIAWHPAAPGQVIEEAVSLVDMVPSVFGWMGLEIGDHVMGGEDISRMVKATSDGPFRWGVHGTLPWSDSERSLYASGIAYGPEQMGVIETGWKYVWHEISASSELFDLRQDGAERNPVTDQPDRADELDGRVANYFEWMQDEAIVRPEISDEQLEHLKGIGYLQGVGSDEEEDAPRAGLEALNAAVVNPGDENQDDADEGLDAPEGKTPEGDEPEGDGLEDGAQASPRTDGEGR